MLGAIAFGVIVVGVTLLNDKTEEIQEYILDLIDGSYFLENRKEILIFTIPAILILLVTYFIMDRRHKREMLKFTSTIKIAPEEYERNKKILTDEAVRTLVESPEYLQYLTSKQKGELKEVELNEDDKIVLSDDSDNEGEEIRKESEVKAE